MVEVKKETSLSLAALEAIGRYQDGIDGRYRAEAIRQLIDLGISSSIEVANYRSKGEKRILLNVGEASHAAVNAIRKKILPEEDRTYEIAYRLVILRGLHEAGHPPVE